MQLHFGLLEQKEKNLRHSLQFKPWELLYDFSLARSEFRLLGFTHLLSRHFS